jgi:hypothetical protein
MSLILTGSFLPLNVYLNDQRSSYPENRASILLMKFLIPLIPLPPPLVKGERGGLKGGRGDFKISDIKIFSRPFSRLADRK